MKRAHERGNAIIEFSLMAPWLVFLFIGAMDWGFYAYSVISLQAAARVGALYASSSTSAATDTTTVCTYALEQMRRMANVGSTMTSCATGSAVSGTAPVGVAASLVSGPDGNNAAQVSVTYQTPIYMPLIGSLPKQITLTRTVTMRLRS
jgi:Flp pilus assembly protein TadG